MADLVLHAALAIDGDDGGFGFGFGEASIGDGGGEEFTPFDLEVVEVDAVLRALGPCDAGFNGGEVEIDDLGEFEGVAVGGDAPEALGLVVVFNGGAELGRAAGAGEVAGGDFIDAEEAHGRAVFGGHVGDGGAVGQAEGLGTGAEEFDEFADNFGFAENLGDEQDEVGGGDPGVERSGQIDADDFGDEEGDGLTKHSGFRLDAAHAPADDAEAVDHGGVGIGADEGVRIENAVFLKHALGEVFEVHLVDDADAGRDHFEGIEGLLAPFEELVALAVAVEFEVEVFLQRVGAAGVIDLHGVVDDEIDGDQRLDHFRVLAHAIDGGAHRGEIDEERHAGEVLEHDAGDDEGDFIVAGRLGVVVGEVGDVLFRDFEPVLVAEE